VKNSLTDLNNYLFESLERINDDSLDDAGLERELKRADAVAKTAKMIIDNASTQLQAIKYADEMGYNENGKYLIASMAPELEDTEKKKNEKAVAKRSK
jgi:hypothetical protein